MSGERQLTKADLQAARRSWKKVQAEPDPNSQTIGVLLWASVWAEALMRTAEDQIKREPPNPDT